MKLMKLKTDKKSFYSLAVEKAIRKLHAGLQL